MMAMSSAILVTMALLLVSAHSVAGRPQGEGKIALSLLFDGMSGDIQMQQNAAQQAVAAVLGMTLDNVKQVKQMAAATTFKIDQTLFGFASPLLADAYIAANMDTVVILPALNVALLATGAFDNTPLINVAAVAASV